MAWRIPQLSHRAPAIRWLVLLSVFIPCTVARCQEGKPDEEAGAAKPSDSAATAPAPVTSKNTLHVTVGENVVHADARIEYRASQGDLPQLKVALPAGHRILAVSLAGRGIKDWTVTQDANRQVLTIPLQGEQRQEGIVEVHTEAPFAGGELTVAGSDDAGAVYGIHTLDDPGESGTVVVTAGRGISLTMEPPQGVTRIEDATPLDISQPSRTDSFRFYNTRFSLKLRAEPISPRITVDQSTRITFLETQLRLEANLTYEIRDAGVSKLKIEVPKNVEIDGDSIGADAMEDFEIDEASGALTVIFKRKQQGTIGISFSGRRYLDETDFTRPELLPLFRPEGVERESGRITVLTTAGLDVIVDDKERRGVRPVPAETSPLVAGLRVASSWTYARQPVALSATLVRKPPHVWATTATNLDVHAGRVDVKTHLEFDIQNIATDTFRIAVPAAAVASLKIETSTHSNAPRVRQVDPDSQPEGEYLVLSVVSERPVVGRFPLDIAYEIKTPAEAAGTSQIAAAIVRVDGYVVVDADDKPKTIAVDQITGEMSVDADRGLVVNVDPSAGKVESIDVTELQHVPREGLLAYRWSGQPVAFQVKAAVARAGQSVQTVVPRAAVELVVGNGDQIVWRWRGRILTSQRQQVPVELPAGAEIVAAYIDSGPTLVVKDSEQPTEEGWERFAVNVVRATPTEKSFLLTLQFRSPTPARAFASGGGDLYLRLPRFRDDSEPVAIHHLRAAVWVPRQYVLLGLPDHYLAEVPAAPWRVPGSGRTTNPVTEDLDEWIDGANVAPVDFPADGHVYHYQSLGGGEPLRVRWWQMPFYTRVLSGALLVVAIVLCATSWRNRLTIAALGGLIFVLYAFDNPTVAWYGLVAARFGLIGLVVIWLIHAAVRPPGRSMASSGVSRTESLASPPTAASSVASHPATAAGGPAFPDSKTMNAS